MTQEELNNVQEQAQDTESSIVECKMQKFTVIPTDDGRFQVNRWNDVSQQYEPQGRLFPTIELAEIAAEKAQEMYDEVQSLYNEEKDE